MRREGLSSSLLSSVGRLSYSRCKRIHPSPGKLRIAKATNLERVGVDYVVTHNGLPIVKICADGAIIVDCQGCRDKSTLAKVRAITGEDIVSADRRWLIGGIVYYDGINVGRPRNEEESKEQDSMYMDI